ncbi:MAG: pilus assembly protein PilM, partial [Planctomycetota bacterium]
MAGNQRAWGIEVGVAAVKAICLERSGDQVAVSDFCVIPHSRTLGDPDLSGQESDAIVRFSLGQLISQKSLEGETLVMNLPGQDALIRFAKLPPAEPKAIPGLVEYEAKQQIPFPIEEVEWDYQAFQDDDSPEIEVGIFATTRAKVQDLLSRWSDSGLSPEALTVGPLAVLNAVAWDSGLVDSNKNGASIRDEEEPLVVLDIGTHASDVVIAHRGRCWIRTFPVGGTHFTQAVKDTFHLPYAKAESLKQDAASSKYTKQIMQAMR